MQNTFYLAVGVCCWLQICNSAVNMVVMGLVLGQSLMMHIYPVIMQKYLLFIMNCFCLHVK